MSIPLDADQLEDLLDDIPWASAEALANFARPQQEFALHWVKTLEDHSAVLERVVLGLSGRRLRLEPGDSIYTDTETLYLPATVSRFEGRDDNFCFLKAAATNLWAQTRFGTWQRGVVEALARFETPDRALRAANAPLGVVCSPLCPCIPMIM